MTRKQITNRREFLFKEYQAGRITASKLCKMITQLEQQNTKELDEARAEIERLQGEVIRVAAPVEYVQSTYSTTSQPKTSVDDLSGRKGRVMDNIRLISELEKLQDENKMLMRTLEQERNKNESLMFMVQNQRCCRNCGNHASWNFDICGFGENPQDENEGPHCRRNGLKRWRPMEYRRAKET